jgi:protease-4
VQGGITTGKSERSPFGTGTAGSETIAGAIREAREASDVKAILLRVESPGGSAIGSDAISREVTLAAKSKPVVVSMSDVAASGGYYVSMAATAIVAEPATITGSIGVVGGKFNLRDLYHKLGITKDSVGRGRHALLESDYRDWSDEEIRLVRSHMEHLYRAFLAKAAEGRRKTEDEIHEVARGRIWTGRQAKERGLVDELGGLARALAIAKEKAGIAADRDVSIVRYPEPKGLLEILQESFGVRALGAPALADEPRFAGIAERLLLLERLAGERILALPPCDVALR